MYLKKASNMDSWIISCFFCREISAPTPNTIRLDLLNMRMEKSEPTLYSHMVVGLMVMFIQSDPNP